MLYVTWSVLLECVACDRSPCWEHYKGERNQVWEKWVVVVAQIYGCAHSLVDLSVSLSSQQAVSLGTQQVEAATAAAPFLLRC
jgi:hypothetical protein